ncbi:hypothetical protein ACWEQJ_15665 [Streptomyces cyaneofuscatus]
MRTDLKVDWRIPPSPPGWTGRLERFMGPGRTRAESVVEAGGGIAVALVLAAFLWRVDSRPDWSALQWAVVAVVGLDLIGGVLTNASNAAKRWYHRQNPRGRRSRLTFVGMHTLHLAAIGLVVLDGDWIWTLGNAAALLMGAVLVEFAPVALTRPVAMACYMAAVLLNLGWLEVPAALAWFAPLFFLKLLVCHLVAEAPLEAARPGRR